uniref:Polycystic kidney disease protein 1-like 2 n=3 Tax=Petromyzon marinus TaxID=7757 RepID=A0AAJ7XFR5_PETMA|nr:polycystic kidney disease protein 1-like 2 [Petromyzon marinus]
MSHATAVKYAWLQGLLLTSASLAVSLAPPDRLIAAAQSGIARGRSSGSGCLLLASDIGKHGSDNNPTESSSPRPLSQHLPEGREKRSTESIGQGFLGDQKQTSSEAIRQESPGNGKAPLLGLESNDPQNVSADKPKNVPTAHQPRLVGRLGHDDEQQSPGARCRNCRGGGRPGSRRMRRKSGNAFGNGNGKGQGQGNVGNDGQINVQGSNGSRNSTTNDQWWSTAGEGWTLSDCLISVGLQSGFIPDSAFTATSEDSAAGLGATSARLNNAAGSWSPRHDRTGEYLQVDLGVSFPISGLVLQGAPGNNTWVTDFQVVVLRADGKEWKPLDAKGENQVFAGNVDGTTERSLLFNTTVPASGIRVMPVAWHGRISLRLELLACSKALKTPEIDYDPTSVNGKVKITVANLPGGPVCFRWDMGNGENLILGPMFCKDGCPSCQYVTLDYKSGSFQFTYKQMRMFTATVNATNVISSASQSMNVTVNRFGCKLGAVTIQDDAKAADAPKVVRITDGLSLPVDVQRSCVVSGMRMSLKWTAQQINHTRSYSGNSNTLTIVFAPNQFPLGTYQLTVTAIISLAGIQSVSEPVFLRFEEPLLDVQLSGGHYRLVGEGRDILVEAVSSSGDAAAVSGVAYDWFCKTNAMLEFAMANASACAGAKVVGRRVFRLPGASVVASSIFYVRLVASSGSRVVTSEQTINVTKGTPLEITIRCLENCNEKIDPTSTFYAVAQCSNCTRGEDISYSWSLRQFNTDTTAYDIDQGSLVRQSGIGLKVNADSLAAGGRYELTVEASGMRGQMGQSKMWTSATRPPYGGTCAVQPTSGVALSTAFQFSCQGWLGDDAAAPSDLLYRVVVHSGERQLVVSRSSTRESAALMLPAGEARGGAGSGGGAGDILQVSVFVCSPIGSCSEFPMAIEVSALPQDQLEVTLRELVSPGGTLDTLVADQDVQRTLQLVRVAGVSLSQDVSPGHKQQMTYALLQVIYNASSQIHTANDAVEVLNSVHDLTSDQQDLDLNSQVVAAKIVEGVMNNLKNSSSTSREDLLKISPALVGVVGGLTATSSDRVSAAAAAALDADYSPDSLDMNPQEAERFRLQQSEVYRERLAQQTPQTMQVVDSCKQAMDDFTGMMLDAMVFGEEPIVVTANNLSVTMGLNTLGSVQDKQWDNGLTNLNASFTNVSDELLLQTANIQVLSFDKNPYVWDASSRINSPVVQLSVSAEHNGSGASVVVSLRNRDAVQPIAMAVPNCTVATDCLAISKFDIGTAASAIFMKFTPPPATGELELDVFLKFNGTPSARPPDYDFRFSLPQDGQYSVFVPSGSVKVGVYFLGLRATGNSTDASNRRAKRALTNNVTASMAMSLHRLTCKIWDPERNVWMTGVAQVHPDSSAEETVCVATLTTGALARATFAAEFFVPPNTIDFTTVFAKFDLRSNAAVFTTVIAILLLYLLLLLYARRADRRDKDNWKIRPLVDNDDSHAYVYLLSIVTGMRAGAGTQSRVYFTVHFSLGDTGTRILHNGHLKGFSRGSTVTFEMTVPYYWGEPRNITIWHDNSGPGGQGSWFLRHILLHDIHAKQTFAFPCDRWLAAEFEDGQLCRELPVAGFQFVPSTGMVFSSTVQSKITDDHMWVSVFMRPTRSAFSRVQRISCCVSLLFLTMVTNAMWFETGPSTGSDNVQIGPFTLSLSEMLIGLMSNLIVFPISFVIVAVFRRQTYSPATLRFFETHGKGEGDPGPQRKPPLCRRITATAFYKFVAWSLVFLSVVTSGFFTILYSMEWGPDKANLWLRVFIMSFFQSIIIVQPVKVVCIAFFVSLLMKKKRKPLHIDDTLELFKDKADTFEWPKADDHCKLPTQAAELPSADYLPGPPRGAALLAMRRARERERAAWERVRQLILFLMHAALLVFITYRGRDPYAFLVQNSVRNAFVLNSFDHVTDVSSFWDWMQNGFLPNFYPHAWYNGERMSWRERYYLRDFSTIRVGPGRLRQIRSVPQRFNDVMGLQHKVPGGDEEMTGSFLEGWQSANSTNTSGQRNYWSYSTAQALQGLTTVGDLALYSGGGFIAELGLNLADGTEIVANLSSASWLDHSTRAVLTEFTGYNMNTDLFCSVTLLLEFSQGGDAHGHAYIHVFRIESFVGKLETLTGVVYIVFAILLVIIAATEALRLSELGVAYFKSFWNIAELLSITLGAASVVTYFIKMSVATRTLEKFRTDPHKFVNFQELVTWDQQLSELLATLVFVSTIKVLGHMKSLRQFEVLVGAFSEARDHIQGFAVIVVVVFCSFGQLTSLLFAGSLRNYRTFTTCLEQLFSLLLGQPGYGELYAANRVLGPLIYFAFTSVNTFVIVNFSLGILSEGFVSFRRVLREQPHSLGLHEALLSRIRAVLAAVPALK